MSNLMLPNFVNFLYFTFLFQNVNVERGIAVCTVTGSRPPM